jgi:hypothetical protein
VNFFALENGQYLGEDGIADEETTVFKDVTGVYVGYNDGEGYYADFEFIIKGMGGNDARTLESSRLPLPPMKARRLTRQSKSQSLKKTARR